MNDNEKRRNMEQLDDRKLCDLLSEALDNEDLTVSEELKHKTLERIREHQEMMETQTGEVVRLSDRRRTLKRWLPYVSLAACAMLLVSVYVLKLSKPFGTQNTKLAGDMVDKSGDVAGQNAAGGGMDTDIVMNGATPADDSKLGSLADNYGQRGDSTASIKDLVEDIIGTTKPINEAQGEKTDGSQTKDGKDELRNDAYLDTDMSCAEGFVSDKTMFIASEGLVAAFENAGWRLTKNELLVCGDTVVFTSEREEQLIAMLLETGVVLEEESKNDKAACTLRAETEQGVLLIEVYDTQLRLHGCE